MKSGQPVAPIVEYVPKRPDPKNETERRERGLEELRASLANMRADRARLAKRIETTEATIKRVESELAELKK